MKTINREYGIDILRLFAMYLVVLCHVVSANKLAISDYSLSQDIVLKGMRSVYICAVNMFALVSGYLGLCAEHKIRRIVFLWFEVFFYSVVLLIISCCLGTPFCLRLLYQYMRPAYNCVGYWYFRMYFILFFWMPIFNYFIGNAPQYLIRRCLISFIVLFSVITVFTPVGHVTFGLHEGYSVMWLAFLYLLGAYIKKQKSYFDVFTKRLLSIIIFSCFAILIISQYVDKMLPTCLDVIWGKKDFLMRYTSPLVLMASVSTLILFSRISTTHNKTFDRLISLIAPSAFGVYLIHEHFIFNNYVYVGRFEWVMKYNGFLMGLYFLGGAFVIFLLCLLIDFTRHQIVAFCHLRKLYDCVENHIVTRLGRIMKTVIHKG